MNIKNKNKVLLFATIITLGATVFSRPCKALPLTNDRVCETPACIHSAAYILKNMDPSIDPCDNFYQFACGKFLEETVIPDDQDFVSVFSTTTNKLLKQLRIKVSDAIEKSDPPVVTKMKSYYQMCMDENKIEKNSENELRELLKNMGGCPVLDDSSWNEKNFDWKRSVFEANKIGYDTNTFVKMTVELDPNNSTKFIVHVDQAETELPKEILIFGMDFFIVKLYLTTLVNVVAPLGVNKEQALKELSDTVKFQIELAKISLLEEERQNKSKLNNRMTLRQLQANFRDEQWAEYFNEILSPYARLNSDDEIIVAVPNFLERISGLIKKTPKRVLANYACARAIVQSIDYMGQKFLKVKAQANGAFSDIKEQPPRSTECLANLYSHFSTALSWLYMTHYFAKNTKIDASYLTENIRKSLHHLVKKADWMDEATKGAALEKLIFLKAYAGYPDELENITLMNEYFQELTLHHGSFLRSEISLKQFENRILYSQLRKPVNETKWIEHSLIARVNAAYSPSLHSIDLPAGILQEHFYNDKRPNYMNYGAIGSIIGHEMSHSFDDLGSQYDKNGNLFNWWKNETKKEYLIKAKCFIEQYNNYTVKEVNMNINGSQTQAENIADNIGLKAAYFAYDKWAKKNSKESRLPGLYYSPQQMFWLSYANNWCKKMQPKKLMNSVATDEHAPSEFRVIGALSNLKEFSNDFKCPLGSPMNPINKCSVW